MISNFIAEVEEYKNNKKNRRVSVEKKIIF